MDHCEGKPHNQSGMDLNHFETSSKNFNHQ